MENDLKSIVCWRGETKQSETVLLVASFIFLYFTKICQKFEIVGEKRFGTFKLAKAIIELATFPVTVYSCRKFPLPRHYNEIQFDFIIYMMDVSDRMSNDTLQKQLSYLDVDYISGRMVFLTVRTTSTTPHDLENAQELTKIYGGILMIVNCEHESELEETAKKLLEMTKITSRLSTDLTSEFLFSLNIFAQKDA